MRQESSGATQNDTNLDLVSYSSPPVIEVVCGIQFEPLHRFMSVHYGEFRQLVKDEYPKIEERSPVIDLFEDRKSPTLSDAVETLEAPPLRRVFYVDDSGNFLLQLQPSRFLANWRRMRAEDQYPRFSATYKRFLERWDTFWRFAKEHELGMPRANQYELTYINHILSIDEGFPAAIEYFMPLLSWSRARSLDFLPRPLSIAMRLRFPLPENGGSLHLKVDHGQRKHDGKEILVLEFTARGPAAQDWSDMRRWFGMAHQQIVTGFTDLTSEAAHEHWGKLRDKS
jgi:uncharacterized protein (TIGR04255 family)